VFLNPALALLRLHGIGQSSWGNDDHPVEIGAGYETSRSKALEAAENRLAEVEKLIFTPNDDTAHCRDNNFINLRLNFYLSLVELSISVNFFFACSQRSARSLTYGALLSEWAGLLSQGSRRP